MLGFFSKWLPATTNSPPSQNGKESSTSDAQLRQDEDSDSAKTVVGSSSSSPRLPAPLSAVSERATDALPGSTSTSKPTPVPRRPSTPPVYEYISECVRPQAQQIGAEPGF